MFDTSASRWRALQTRCEESRSAFVYAVLTTRIYCRPTCPARLARRANVVFYDSAAEAAAAGFRPCKRCTPEDQQSGEEDGTPKKAVRQACAILEQTSGMRTVNDLAKDVGLSPRYLHAAFKKVMGVTPGLYARQLKMNKNERPKMTRNNVEGLSERPELSSESWMALNVQTGEHHHSAIFAPMLDGSKSLQFPAVDEYPFSCTEEEHHAYQDATLRIDQSFITSDWSSYIRSNSEISASNAAWLDQHDPWPLEGKPLTRIKSPTCHLDIVDPLFEEGPLQKDGWWLDGDRS